MEESDGADAPAFEMAHKATHAAAQALQQMTNPVDEDVALPLVLALSLADACATPEDKITLLMLAAAAGAAQCTRALLEKNAHLDALDCFGVDALYYAVRLQHTHIVDALLLAGADVNRAKCVAGGTSLIEAAVLGNTDITQLLCAARAEPSAKDIADDSAVKAALRASSWSVLTVLAAYGASWGKPEMACSEGGWHQTQAAGALEAGRAAFLLGVPGVSAKSIPQLMDGDGSTPLHVCAKRGWASGARTLLHSKANPHARDCTGRDACSLAAASSYHRVVRVLLANGANPKLAASSNGRTALMAASLASSVRSVVLLWEAHADLHATDHDGRSAVMLAASEGGDVDTIALLSGLMFTRDLFARRVSSKETARLFKQRSDLARLLSTHRRVDAKNVLTSAEMVVSVSQSFGGGADLREEVHGTPSPETQGVGLFMFGVKLNYTRHRAEERAEERARRREKRLVNKRQSAAGRLERGSFHPQQTHGTNTVSSSPRAESPGLRMMRRLSLGWKEPAHDGAGTPPVESHDSHERSPNSSGRASPMMRLLADMDDDGDELSESPSEIAARYATGPELSYEYSTDRDFVRKQRVERWRKAHAALLAPTLDALLDDDSEIVETADVTDTEVGVEGTEQAGDAPSIRLEPLLLSTRLPTAEELNELLFETSERARKEGHREQPPAYAFVKPGGGITSTKGEKARTSEYVASGGLFEEAENAMQGYETVAVDEGTREADRKPAAHLKNKEMKLSALYPYALTPEKIKAINKRAKGYGRESA